MNFFSMLCHYLGGGLEGIRAPISNVIGEIIYFLVNFGDAILEPTVRLLIYHASCLHILSHPQGCYNSTAELEDEPGIQDLAAEYMMMRRLMLGLPILVIGLFCGSWSDKFGNKLPVIVPTFGNLGGVLLYLICTLNPGKNIPLLLIGASIRGLCGRTPIITMATHSYVSEVSTEEQRTGRLSILQSMNYFGYLTGSFMLGILLDYTSYSIVFGIVLVLFSLCIPITLIFMTDKSSVKGISLCQPCGSISDEDMESEKEQPYWFSLTYVRDSLLVLTVRRQYYKRLKLWLLFGLMFMTQAWKAGEIEILVLFAERAPFSLTDGHYGYLLATESACMAFSTCVVVPVLSGWFKVGDVALIMIGTCARLLRLLIFIYAKNTGILYLAIILGSPISISVTGLRALISKVVHREELNRVFSLLSCIETAASLIGAFIFLSIYTQTSKTTNNKITFEVAIAVQVALLALLVLLGYLNQKYSENYETLEEEEVGSTTPSTPTQTKVTLENTKLEDPVTENHKSYNSIH